MQYALVQGRPLDQIREDGLFAGGASQLQLTSTADDVRRRGVGLPRTGATSVTASPRDHGSPRSTRNRDRKGPFVRITRETVYTNQAGAVVARSRQIGIAR